MHGWEPKETREFLKKNTLSPGFNGQNNHKHSQSVLQFTETVLHSQFHSQYALQFIENVSQHCQIK